MRYFICLLILVFAFNLNAQLPSPSLNKSGFCFNRVDSTIQPPFYIKKAISADFDNDTYKDVLVFTEFDVYVYLNNGSGKLNTAPPLKITSIFTQSASIDPIIDICSGYFDNDTKPDLAITNGYEIFLFHNNSTPSNLNFLYEGEIQAESGYEFKKIEAADLDNDSHVDITALYFSSSGDWNLMAIRNFSSNVGSYDFQKKDAFEILAGFEVNSPYFRIADLNNDGHNDVIVADKTVENVIEVYKSDYSSNPSSLFDINPHLSIGDFSYPKSFRTIDVNNDGSKDFIVLKVDPFDKKDTLYTYLGNGSFTLTTNSANKYGFLAIDDLTHNADFEIVDFNNDGLKDFCYLKSNDTLLIMSGISTAPYIDATVNKITLRSVPTYTDSFNTSFIIEDFNKDNYIDLFVYENYHTVNLKPSTILNQSYTSSITVSKSTPYCVGDQIILNNVILPTSASVTSVLWNGVSSGSATTQYTVNTSSTSSTSYSSSVTYSIFTGNTCKVSSSNSVSITVNPKPTLTLSLVSASVCPGTSFTLTAQGSETTALWQPGSLSGFNTVVSPAATTIYSITQTNAAGCSETGTVIIGVLKTPTVNIVPNGLVQACEGQSVKLKAINASGSAFNSYQWYSSSSGALSNNDSVLVLTPQNTSTITVKVYDYSLSNCYGKDSVQVIILPKPTLNASVNPQKVCPGKPTTITVTGAQSYTWQPVHLGNGNQVVVRPVSYFKTYTVSATDAYGCETTDTITVDVEKKCGLTVYNLVSPNSDGSNDYFEIDGISDFKHTVSIYNRWGQKLFESADYKNNWDGSSESNGVHVPAGTYFYIIELPEQKEIFKGWIELIKK